MFFKSAIFVLTTLVLIKSSMQRPCIQNGRSACIPLLGISYVPVAMDTVVNCPDQQIQPINCDSYNGYPCSDGTTGIGSSDNNPTLAAIQYQEGVSSTGTDSSGNSGPYNFAYGDNGQAAIVSK